MLRYILMAYLLTGLFLDIACVISVVRARNWKWQDSVMCVFFPLTWLPFAVAVLVSDALKKEAPSDD